MYTIQIMKTKLTYLTVAFGMMLGLASCNMDYYPSDEQSAEVIMQEASATIMDGCYALLKDEVEYLGYPSGNTYCRHWFQMAEFPADNICLSGRSTDPLFQAATYTMTDNLQNVGTLWMLAYKIIYMTNTLIETLDANTEDNKQIVGEAYFLRALMHLNMVTLFAKPYHKDEHDQMGVPLRTAALSTVTERDPVGKVYDQIVEDLQKASELMGKSRGNAGYPSKEAALGLLSRVYLYMERYEDCYQLVEQMLGGTGKDAALVKLDPNLASYFANAKTSQETLFCIAHETTEDRGQSSIGSMFNKDGGGWGEIYPSFPLLNLYERYPEDIRYTAFIRPQYSGGVPSENLNVFVPVRDQNNSNPNAMRKLKSFSATYNASNDTYTFKEGQITYTVKKRPAAQDEYFEYEIENYKGEEHLQVRLMPSNIMDRETYPRYYMTKFGYQNGSPTLSSPVVLRWAEVILNAAEAHAHAGNEDAALAYVNAIRQRAGIPQEGMFSTNSMHGYQNALEVVMDERRLELAFEGHRMFDVYRNKLNMDRKYPGYQEWKVVPYTEPHILYPIPNAEWTVSGIKQNDEY